MLDFSDPASVVNLLGVAVPLIVALVTRKYASQGLKAVSNVVTTALVSALAYLATADGYDFVGFLEAFVGTFVISIASYYGIIKPTGLAGTVADKSASFGIGSPPTFETEDKGEESPLGADVPNATLDADIASLWTRVSELQSEVDRLENVKSNRRPTKDVSI